MSDYIPDRPLVLIGGGGHAKVLADALLEQGCRILAVADPKYAEKPESKLFGLPTISDDRDLKKFRPDEVYLVNGLGILPGSKRRREIQQRYSDMGYVFAQVIHPSAVIGRDVQIGKGVQVLAVVV